jgi:Tfp pilus assembly protein PilF
MVRIRVLLSGLTLMGVVLPCGCAQTQQASTLQGPGKDLARQWAQAARQPIDGNDAKPGPEPKLQPLTYFSAGNLFEKQGNYAQAIEQYRRAVELNSSFAAAYSRLGLCYTKTRQYGLAVEALKRGADLQPASALLWNNLGFAYLAQENYPQAEQCLGKALKAEPGFVRARLNMAIALVQQKRDGEAMQHLSAFLPESLARYNLGTLQMGAGRPAEARTSFERALALQTDFPAARKGLQECLVRLPHSSQASAQDHASLAPAASGMAAAQPAATPSGQGGATDATCKAADRMPASAESDNDADSRVQPALASHNAPATRLIEGVDDEPAIANAATGCPKGGTAAGALLEVVSFLPAPDHFAWGRSVIFTDTAGVPLTWGPLATSAIAQAQVEAEPAIEVLPQAATVEVGQPASVADLDLASLRWAAWTDAVGYLRVDVALLSNEQLPAVLSKWLCALKELESVTPVLYGATAWADDVAKEQY